MRAYVLVTVLPLMLLGACNVKIGNDDKSGNATDASVSVGEDGNVSVATTAGAKGLSVSVPGFQAKLDIPGLTMGGGDNMDIDGVKLYPGTKVEAVNVNGHDGPGSGVAMRFTSDAAPAALAQYYAGSARDHDFSNVAVTNEGSQSTMTANKPDGDKLTISMAAAPKGGTAGQITVIDSK